MGGEFSMGSFPPPITPLASLPLETIRVKNTKFKTICSREYENDGFFITRRQFAAVFGFVPEAAFKIWSHFDPQSAMQVVASDVFGGMTLASSSGIEQKIQFLFQQGDKNGDKKMNSTELTMIMHSASRGFARMKKIGSPSMEVCEKIVATAFSHSEVNLDERGEIAVADVIMLCQADDRLRHYLSNLDSSQGADISNLYKQQSEILKELSLIDAMLDTIVRFEDAVEGDEMNYVKERGGDIKDIVYDGLLESESEAARMYLNDLTTHVVETTRDLPAEDRKQVELEARRQATRRAKRKRRMREEEEMEMGRFGDAAAFQIGYKRVQSSKVVGGKKSMGSEAEKNASLGHIATKWNTMKLSNDGLIKLDVDLLEDLVEATGKIIHDREAKAALRELPSNQLGKHSLHDFIKWWKQRLKKLEAPDIPPWRARLHTVLAQLERPWKFLDNLIRETKRQVSINKEEGEWVDWVEGESSDEEEGDLTPEEVAKKKAEEEEVAAANRRRQMAFPLTKTAWDSDDEGNNGDSDDDENDKESKLAVSIAVGHIQKEKPASIKFDFAASGEGVGVSIAGGDGTGQPQQLQQGQQQMPTPNNSRPNTGQSSRPTSQGANVAHSHIRLYAKQVLDDAFRTASPDWALKHQETKVFASALWVDFAVREEAGEALIKKMVEQISFFLDSVPRDYAKPLYVASKVEEVTLSSSRDAKKYIRITFLNDVDPFYEFEKILPPKTHPKDMVDKLSLHFEFNLTLREILNLTGQFVDYDKRCFGPQEDELGEKGMEPAVFVNSVKQRRKAALRAAKRIAKKEMPLEDMKQHLEARGYSTAGTISDIIERTKDMFEVQAEVCGYGEMSNFGASISDAIFKRVDRDNDGCLNFLEMNTLQRRLGGTAIEYPGKYVSVMKESGYATNSKGWLTRAGLAAYYERWGQLANDTECLGIGSIDDYVCASVSLTGEIRSAVVGFVDKVLDKARHAHHKLKLSSFIGRFTKDIYLDWECQRLSDLFVKGGCPLFVTAPGGPAIFLRNMRMMLADGRKGMIPEFRRGVADFLGKGWGSSRADEWMIWTEAELKEEKKRVERDKIDRIVACGEETGINVAEYGIGTLDGWKQFTLADGTQPMWLKLELKRQKEEDEHENFLRSQADEKFSEFLDVPKGTVKLLASLDEELESLGETLNKALPRRQREQLEAMQEQKRADFVKNSELLERAVHMSCHHGLRSYDAMRSVLSGVHSVNWGNRTFTLRGELNGFDFFEELPLGMGEEGDISAAYMAKMKRAKERKERAKRHIEEEKAKAILDEKEKHARAEEDAIRKAKERAEEEKQLYSRGADARLRGYNKTSDQKLCIEMWRRLFLLFENRYNELDSNRDIHAVAVASNNIGVVMFEFGEGQMANVQESVTRLRKADELITGKLKEIKTACMEKALAEMARQREELEEIARKKNADRIKKAQEAKGNTNKRQSEIMMESVNRAAKMAEQTVEEANKLALELMKEFESGSDNDSDQDNSDDNNSSSDSGDENGGEDEEKKGNENDFDDTFIETPEIIPIEERAKQMQQKKKGTGGHRRSTLIPPHLKQKVTIPEDVALTAAIIKCNLVTLLNEISEPADDDENDERQHLEFDCYSLYQDYVSDATKMSKRMEVFVKGVGVAKLDEFPPPNFEEWGVRTTKEDLLIMAEMEKKKEEERKLTEKLREEKAARKAARQAKRDAKADKKRMKELGFQELQALNADGGVDLEALEIINPKKAAKIRDRQERFEAGLQRKKAIEEKRQANLRAIEERQNLERVKKEKYEAKIAMREEEVQKIIEDDIERRGGFKGFISGARWSARPDEEEIRNMLIEREEMAIKDKKMGKKQAKKEKKEQKKREQAAKEREERRRAREDISSEESSDGTAGS